MEASPTPSRQSSCYRNDWGAIHEALVKDTINLDKALRRFVQSEAERRLPPTWSCATLSMSIVP
jgi:hypothetical protein